MTTHLFHRDWVCLVDAETLKAKQLEWREKNRSEFGTIREPLWRQLTLRGHLEGAYLELVNVDGEVLRTQVFLGGYERKLSWTWSELGEVSLAKLEAFAEHERYAVAQKLLRLHNDLLRGHQAIRQVLTMQLGNPVDISAQARAQ